MSGLDAEQPLTPPAAVPEVAAEQAVGMVAIPPDRQAELAAKAQAFVDELAAVEPGSNEYVRKVAGFSRLGEKEMQASSRASSELLSRPAASLAAARGRGAQGDPQFTVLRTLQDLRATVSDFDPGRLNLGVRGRVLSRIPGGRKLRHYFQRYETAQKQLDAIISALVSGEDALMRDNAAIEQERADLWKTTERLNEYVTLAAALDTATSASIEEVRVTDPARAQALTSDALFAIRQRRQDLTTQIAVSVQAYLALDVIRKNNLELIKGVERAKTTTVAALRTAVVVAQALENQRLVLDQIGALHDSTNSLIDRTSELLRQQTGSIQDEQSRPAVDVETLQRAFDNVFQTMDSIDSYRGKAIENMAATVDALEHQVSRSRTYIERSRSQR